MSLKPHLPPIVQAAPAPAATPAALRGWPLLRLGFRPFYLGAALFGALAVPLWIALFLGRVTADFPVPALLWHAHEMLFGFAVAVIVGFLLTAGKAWTTFPTPRGAALGALALLWLSARVAAVAAPYPVYAVLDVLLLPVVAAILLELLLRARNRRNLPVAGLLVLLSVANLLYHLSVAGIVDVPPLRPLYAALGLIVMIECVIAGRVVPNFTMNATPGLQLKSRPRWDAATLAVTALALASWVFAAPAAYALTACAAAALLQAQRQWRWQPWVTRGRPILWILHAAYAWIPAAFALLALAQLGWVPVSAGVHALAVGATGGLIIGMITRTARGHTGRPLRVSRPEVAAYALVMAAAALRVFAPLAAPELLVPAMVGAAFAWSAAFAIYLAVYAPWLVRTRLDGKDG